MPRKKNFMDELINRYRRSINPPYNWKDYLNLFFTFLLLLGLPVAIFLAQRPQDIRQRAAEETAPTGLRPSVPAAVPDEILVKFKPGVSDKAREHVRNFHGLQKFDEISQIGLHKIKVAPQARDRVIEALNKNPRIEFAEPNYIGEFFGVPNDPKYSTDQWYLSKINAPSAWDLSKGNSSLIVADIDSGVNANHEDLQGKIVPGYNTYLNNTDTSDSLGHGTATAGIIGAATDNSKGIASLGWNIAIMPIRIAKPDNTFDFYSATKAIIYAANQGAEVINMSWGYPSDTQSNTLKNAVDYAWSQGKVLVAASGINNKNFVYYPAKFTNVIAVGATYENDLRWADSSSLGSNYGPELDVVAPGKSLVTTRADGTYSYWSGPSFSSPLVAALAALIKSVLPTLTNQQISDIITSTAVDLGPSGKDDQYGYGRIDAGAALQKATGMTPPPPDTTSPTIDSITPTSGSTVSGAVEITVTASDNIGVTKVEFYVDGVLLPNGEDTTAPYLASWDTTTYSNASHTIMVKAYDLAGNIGTSLPVAVTVNNVFPTPTSTPVVPTLTVTPPTPGLQASVVTVSSISAQTTATGATISWITNIPSSSRVKYGLSSATLNLTTVENPTPTISHTVTLTGLAPITRYYYQAVSKNPLGDEFFSPVKTFKTRNR